MYTLFTKYKKGKKSILAYTLHSPAESHGDIGHVQKCFLQKILVFSHFGFNFSLQPAVICLNEKICRRFQEPNCMTLLEIMIKTAIC